MKITEVENCPSDLRYFDDDDLESKLQPQDVEDIVEILNSGSKESNDLQKELEEKNYSKKKEAPPYHYQGLRDSPPQLVIGFPITNVSLLTPSPQVVIVRSHYAFEVWLGQKRIQKVLLSFS